MEETSPFASMVLEETSKSQNSHPYPIGGDVCLSDVSVDKRGSRTS